MKNIAQPVHVYRIRPEAVPIVRRADHVAAPGEASEVVEAWRVIMELRGPLD